MITITTLLLIFHIVKGDDEPPYHDTIQCRQHREEAIHRESIESRYSEAVSAMVKNKTSYKSCETTYYTLFHDIQVDNEYVAYIGWLLYNLKGPCHYYHAKLVLVNTIPSKTFPGLACDFDDVGDDSIVMRVFDAGVEREPALANLYAYIPKNSCQRAYCHLKRYIFGESQFDEDLCNAGCNPVYLVKFDSICL